ncbi:hypothetical protein CDT98_05060 [Cronobacter sakazakii]|nr:hypothetical protein CDT98_05060 [Cronobacter sakazakii]
MFTQDFFTENATHKQNCTSFNPKLVITHNVNNGKPFLYAARSVAQIPQQNAMSLTIKHRMGQRSPVRVTSPPGIWYKASMHFLTVAQ